MSFAERRRTSNEVICNLTNQTVLFGLRPELQSRINALYMVSYFAGGALGTFFGSLAWSHGGWQAVCLTGAAFSLLGMLPLLLRTSAE